jgi:hypothetical protein
MSTINLDVMKQLLREFEEKESLASEEIKVVEQEISDLEGRIQGCRDRLKTVNEDREKIMSMASRYAGGSWLSSPISSSKDGPSQGSKSKIAGAASAGESAKVAQAAAQPGSSTAVASGAGASGKDSSSAQAITGNLTEADEAKQSADSEAAGKAGQAAQAGASESEKGKSEEGKGEEGGDDTIKSINDALRGLFR